jgi:hypothetical protein
MKSLINFICHKWFAKYCVGKMEQFEPWLVLPNLDDSNQCTLMMAVSVIAIYKIQNFNFLFKLNPSPISTDHSTVVHTICCQQTAQYTVLMLPHILATNHSHIQWLTVLVGTCSVLCKLSPGNCELYTCGVTAKLINIY